MQRLQNSSIIVTGAVGDVRPYLAHAAAVVVPLRASPGVANKVLEGMAMAKPVIATPEAVDGLSLVPNRDYMLAATPEDFADAVRMVLRADGEATALGVEARSRVAEHFTWQATIDKLPALIEGETAAGGITPEPAPQAGRQHG